MLATGKFAVGLGMVLCVAAVRGWAAQEPAPAAAAAAADAVVSPENLPRTIDMAELTFHGRKVRGRVIAETETTIHIEGLGGGTTGYPKKGAEDLRRFALKSSLYFEQRADVVHESVWTAGDPGVEAMTARRLYLRALTLTDTDEQTARLKRKMENLATLREQLHKEDLHREELRKAKAEADLVEKEKMLAEAKLKSLEQYDKAITQLQKEFLALHERNRVLATAIEELAEEAEDMADEIDDLDNNRTLIINLNRNYETLKGDVDRLRRLVTRSAND